MRKVAKITLYVLATLALIVVVLNWTVGRLPGEPKPRGSFVGVDGLRVHYLERAGGGTPVVLIHGLPGTAEDFNEVTPLLPGQRTIAFDRPGFGYSGNGYLPFDRQLTTLHALLAQLHIDDPILVGHSYGGTIALGYAERYPNDVHGLVLVDAAAAGVHLGSFDEGQAHVVKFLQLPVIHQIANATFGQLLTTTSIELGDSKAFDPQPVAPAHRDRLLAINSTRVNLQAFAGEQLAANGVIEKLDKRLAAIQVPTVVVQGDHDELIKPKYGRQLARTLPDARLVMVPGGHMAPYTHPFAVATAVRAVKTAGWPRVAQPPAAAKRAAAQAATGSS